jgi:PIN domain nuclease of toxin-antitoxin system
MPQLPDGALVVDASFLLGVLASNPEAQRFTGVLRRSHLAAVNFGEVLYKLHQRAGIGAQATAYQLRTQGVTVEAFGPVAAMHFPALKAIDAAAEAAQIAADPECDVKHLSLADMSCLAHAMAKDLPVLTGDKHWLTLRPHGLTLDIFDFRDPALLA